LKKHLRIVWIVLELGGDLAHSDDFMKTLFIYFFLAGIPAVLAAALQTEDQVQEISDQFMAEVEFGNYEEGFLLLKDHWPLSEADFEALVAQTNEQMAMVGATFGAETGSEQVRSEAVGESLLRLTYLQKFENHAIRWQLTFYRPDGYWLVNQVSWDDDLEALFQD
jgi:hypothetical protein